MLSEAITMVISALLATSSGDSEQRVPYRRIDRGALYWHGHKVTPPYLIEVGFRLASDTVIVNTYVNGLPMTLPDDEKVMKPTASQAQLHAKQMQVLDFADSVGREAKSRNGDVRETTLRALRSRKDVVDSVGVDRDGGPIVYWRESKNPEHVWYVGHSASRFPGTVALGLAEDLDRGMLVLVGSTWTLFSAYDAPRVVAQIDSLQRGLGGRLPQIHNDHVLRDLRNPKPIPDLIREGD